MIPHMVRSDVFHRAEPHRVAAFRRELGIPEDAVVFGRLGQTTPTIWPPALIDAFEAVARETSSAWLLMVGSPDSLAPRIDALAPEVRGRIVRLPFIYGDDVLRECYSALDVFLHVSLIGDSFGLVLCEAMLCGTPVITLCTPARGNSQVEVVGHERGGLVCGNLGAIPVAMRRLIDDSGLRRRLGEQGREWVRRELDPERVTDMLLRVLDAATRSRSPAEIRAELERDPAVETRVAWAWIRRLRDAAIGRVPLKDRILMYVVGVPELYWLIRRIRRPAVRPYLAPEMVSAMPAMTPRSTGSSHAPSPAPEPNGPV